MFLKSWFAQESNNIKWPEISKGHNSNKIFMKLVEKFNQVISSLVPISTLNIKALTQFFEISC